jgi:hypothetical protein
MTVAAAQALLEQASGKPVIIQPDPELKLIAKITIARGPAPAHVISFNPMYGEATNYHIVSQCGYALRIYQTPPADRFDVVSTETGRLEATSLTEGHLRQTGRSFPESARRQLSNQLYDGLILQLRSVPVGFRVDAWVRETFPELIPEQRRSATRQLGEYQAALSPQIKAIAPEKIYRASLGMNAAFALFWSPVLSDPAVTAPYKLAGLLSVGGQLLELAARTPSDPASDRELIRSWGEFLGVAGWYTFAPFGG